MRLTNIITKRHGRENLSADIVYEWEDIFEKMLSLNMVHENPLRMNIWTLRFRAYNLFTPNVPSVIFQMNPWDNLGYNKPNIIPLIIDYFLSPSQYPYFLEHYSKHKLILVSSMEVYNHLKEMKCPFNIRHLPLSISDIYKINKDSKYEKKYDLVLLGRQNRVLSAFLSQYVQRHKDFEYVYHKKEGTHFIYYTSTGECLGDICRREDYIKLMKSAKIGLYSTSSIDGNDNQITNGYNQVTPRFLEYLACGVHVICRYKSNPDTLYYELEKYWPNINAYEEFENAMDCARMNEPDMQFYAEYLSKHYTSTRVKMLQDILKETEL